MENYKNLSIDCLENKKIIMNNKKEYAKMFSEGRESLEKLLLACYEHDIMSQACCSGHLYDNNCFEESYLYLKLKKNDLDIISKFISLYKNTDLKRYCDLEEDINVRSKFKDYFGFCVRSDFDDADDVYYKLIDVINNSEHNYKNCIEYEVLELLKNEILSFRKRKISKHSKGKYEVGGVTLAQNRGNDIYKNSGNYLDIYRLVNIYPNDYAIFNNLVDIEELTKHVNDHRIVDYTELISRYKYESDRQLNELKNVLVKRRI